jgi:hypothetical protein
MIAEDAQYAIVQGLHSGQTVIQNGQLGLVDGQPVEAAGRSPRAVAEN